MTSNTFSLFSTLQSETNPLLSEQESTITNPTLESTTSNNSSDINSDESSSSNNDSVNISSEESTSNEHNTINLISEENTTNNSVNSQEENTTVNDLNSQEKNTTENSDSTLNEQTSSAIFSIDTSSNNSSNSTPINIDEPKYNPWMLSLTGGMNLSKSTYSSTSQSEEDLYKNSTNSKPGIETNFEVKYRLNNSLTFGSGLGLTQFVENYNFSKSAYQYDSTLTWTYVYDSLDTTMFPPPIDSTYTATYDSTSVNLYNQTGQTKGTYASIPLSIGTQIIYNKFRFDFFVAGRFNYLISASGGYILNDAFVPFTKTSNPIFKPWYIDMLLGASVHYNLIGKLYISGTFRYRPPIGQMYQGTTFNRSVQYTHIGLGLSLKL